MFSLKLLGQHASKSAESLEAIDVTVFQLKHFVRCGGICLALSGAPVKLRFHHDKSEEMFQSMVYTQTKVTQKNIPDRKSTIKTLMSAFYNLFAQ